MDAALCGQAVGYFSPAYKLSSPTFKALKFALAPVIASSLSDLAGEVRCLEETGEI